MVTELCTNERKIRQLKDACHRRNLTFGTFVASVSSSVAQYPIPEPNNNKSRHGGTKGRVNTEVEGIIRLWRYLGGG